MLLRDLLGEADFPVFMREHYLRDAVSGEGTAAHLCDRASWETILRLIESTSCDVLVARDGALRRGERPATAAEARALHDQGWSLIPRWAHRHDARLAEIADDLAESLDGDIGLQLYATPRGRHSFGWHYDAEEVFIIQTAGVKEYALRRNTVHRAPVLEAMPRDMRFELETSPVVRCRLRSGDWLYIPGGWWHDAEAIEDSISISVGVMAATPLDAFDLARRRLPQSARWRQRLAPSGTASPLDEDGLVAAYRAEIGGRIDDLRHLIDDDSFMRAFITDRRERLRAAAIPEKSI